MRIAHMYSVVAVAAALSAAGLALAQIQYQDQFCFSTPVPYCSNQCGCPIGNTPTDFCIGTFPSDGPPGSEATYYYCMSQTGATCTAPNLSCGGAVLNCVDPKTGTACGCCGGGTNPPCPYGLCWTCTGPCQPTNKDPQFCSNKLFGCTGAHP